MNSNAINEVQIKMEAATARIEKTQGRLNESEGKNVGKRRWEKDREKMEDREGRIRELNDEIKWNNIHITGFPEETEKGCEDDLEQIIAENFHKLGKDTGIETQRAQRTPFRCNLSWSSAQHRMVKLAKYKHEERILKAAKDEWTLTYKRREVLG